MNGAPPQRCGGFVWVSTTDPGQPTAECTRSGTPGEGCCYLKTPRCPLPQNKTENPGIVGNYTTLISGVAPRALPPPPPPPLPPPPNAPVIHYTPPPWVGQLSGGERNRVHLARMLKSGANLFLLDEPTNDLDVDTLRALEEALLEFAGCAVVVSHDRWFLDRIATHILAFEGDSHVEWFEGNYEAYEVDKKRRLGADADRPTRIKYKPISR